MKEEMNLKGDTERVAFELAKKKIVGSKQKRGLSSHSIFSPLLFLPRNGTSGAGGAMGHPAPPRAFLHDCGWQIHPSVC